MHSAFTCFICILLCLLLNKENFMRRIPLLLTFTVKKTHFIMSAICAWGKCCLNTSRMCLEKNFHVKFLVYVSRGKCLCGLYLTCLCRMSVKNLLICSLSHVQNIGSGGGRGEENFSNIFTYLKV